ncbi:hypothetical protein J7E78_25870 [Paenibacillus polymyxa]|uniref:hypothetical protein n=1 Tax=Paenibacillus polymyxa TaxID=1406 RepID=UPI001BE8359E|nr:hypothetical protein [Paenibacillus polymyxa]MBT2286952.1 hypothetical protein [Paenibacillus polymyxa]
MDCIIPYTHKRLLEAHRLWHQAYDNYFDPEGFRVNINATIQALRNLTFALQNEKEKIIDFDSWYPNWQSKMKTDPIMKWLNEARVKIVHQKDLETKSQANVLIHSYFNLVEYKFDVPALLPSEVIAHNAKSIIKEKIEIPEHQLKECIAVVERRWVAEDLPDWEILDALAYGFNFAKDIVLDAHKQAGSNYIQCSLHDYLHPLSYDDLTGQYSCMNMNATFRTQNIVLSDFQTRAFETNTVKMNEQIISAAKKRYSSKIFSQLSGISKHDPFKFADTLNKVALQVLKKDKYHEWIQFIKVPYKGWELRTVNPEDKSDKFLIMKELAQYVKETKATCVININEAWVSGDVDAIMGGTPVSETQDKAEALCISVITSDGKSRSYMTEFQRRYFGNIKFLETKIAEENPGYFLKPVLDVWETRSEEVSK